MSRRWRYPRSRRGIFYQIFTTQAAPAAPAYIPSFQEPSGRSSKLRTTRRGQFFRIVSTAVVQATQYVPAFGEPAGRNSRPRVTRRGKFYAVPPASVTAVAVWVPPFQNARRSPVRPARRGEFQTVIPTPVLGGPGPLPPSFQRPSTRRLVSPRRGEFFTFPLVGAAPVPSVALPQMPRSRVKVSFTRRGRFWVQPIPQQVVSAPSWVPQIARARRPQVGLVRRGEFLTTPLPRATCPVWMTSRRCGMPVVRRSRVWGPSWVYVPPVPPPPPTSGTAHAATGLAPTASAGAASAASASGGLMTVPTATGG